MTHYAIRYLYLSIGSLSLVLGIVGIFLPLLPTTPFLLLSAFCFSKGSERMHSWLLNHKILGPPIRDWQEHKVISPRSKFFSLTTMAIGIISVSIHFPAHLVVGKYATLAIMLTVSVFVITRKSHREPILRAPTQNLK